MTPKGSKETIPAIWGPRINHPDQLLASDKSVKPTHRNARPTRQMDTTLQSSAEFTH